MLRLSEDCQRSAENVRQLYMLLPKRQATLEQLRMPATEAEIATITGHSLRDVRSILDAHYLNRDPKLAESAIRKLENKHKSVN